MPNRAAITRTLATAAVTSVAVFGAAGPAPASASPHGAVAVKAHLAKKGKKAPVSRVRVRARSAGWKLG